MSRQHRRKQRLKLRSLHLWHRYTGLTAAIFVLVLAVTGLLLNHTERFAFDSRYIQNTLVLDWYGIEAPSEYQAHAVGRTMLTLFGRHLYLGLDEIEGNYERLIGAVRSNDLLVVAVDREILLLMSDGELVERLTGMQGVPSGMRRIGEGPEGGIVVEGGHALYQPDGNFIEWRHWDGTAEAVDWSQPAPLPEALLVELRTHYRGEVLPVERVLLDLHSGRILGRHGYLIMDAAAVLLVVLAITGFFMWRKRRR